MDFEKITESIKTRIDEKYPNDKAASKLLNTICDQALLISIECLKEYHQQLSQDSGK